MHFATRALSLSEDVYVHLVSLLYVDQPTFRCELPPNEADPSILSEAVLAKRDYATNRPRYFIVQRLQRLQAACRRPNEDATLDGLYTSNRLTDALELFTVVYMYLCISK